MTHRRQLLERWSRLAALAVVAAVLGLLLAASAPDTATASPSPMPSSDRVALRIGTVDNPDTLNYYTTLEPVSYEIMDLTYDFLFGMGNDMKPKLDLATEFPTVQNGGILDGGKVWTIHIRPHVKWSDGQPLTAADVAWNYNYNIQHKTKAYYAMIAPMTHAKVINPTTVRMFCSQPTAYIEDSYLPILPKHIWSKLSVQQVTSTYQNTPPYVGSGPFVAVQWQKSSYVHLVRNPYYWGKKPALTDIYFEIYQNADTMAADLRLGKIDAAQDVLPAEFAQLGRTQGIKTVAYNFLGWDYLSFNCFAGKSTGNPVLRDPRFRQALGYAIDDQKIGNIAYGGYAAPATTILPPDTWSNPDYHWQPGTGVLRTFDLAKAGQLLTAAGYPLKNGARVNKEGKPIKLRLWAPSGSQSEQNAAKLIAGWLDQLGLKIAVSTMDAASLSAHIYNYDGDTLAPDFDMYVWTWQGFSDPGQTMSCETTPLIGFANEPGWSDGTYDRLSAQQQEIIDPQKRAAVLWKMQQVMYAQAPWIPFVYPDRLQAYNTSRWTGWTRILGGHGPAFWMGTQGMIDSYLNLKPVSATATGGGGGAGALVVIVLVVAVVVAAALVVLLRRPHRQEVE